MRDSRKICELDGESAERVCDQLKVSSVVIVDSQDEHIGSSEKAVDAAYVRKFSELYLDHAFKSTAARKERGEALAIFSAIVDRVATRFGQQDTIGLLESPEEFLFCVHMMCLDIACVEHGMSEADYLFMVDSHSLTADASMEVVYSKAAASLLKHLQAGEGDEESKQHEEQAEREAEEKARLERQKT